MAKQAKGGKGENKGAKTQDEGLFVLFAQANLHKMPQATVEMVNHINLAMILTKTQVARRLGSVLPP